VVDTLTERIAVVGEEVTLIFEGSDAMAGAANVTFSAFALPNDTTTGTAGLKPVTWNESLTISSTRPGETRGVVQSLVKWTTGVEQTHRARSHLSNFRDRDRQHRQGATGDLREQDAGAGTRVLGDN